MEWDGKPYAADLGQRAGMVAVRRATAMTWLLRGTDADVEKARRFGESEGYTVFTYPTSEPDPIARAKADALKASRGPR